MKFVKAGLVLQDFPREYREAAGVQYMGGVQPEGTRSYYLLLTSHI